MREDRYAYSSALTRSALAQTCDHTLAILSRSSEKRTSDRSYPGSDSLTMVDRFSCAMCLVHTKHTKRRLGEGCKLRYKLITFLILPFPHTSKESPPYRKRWRLVHLPIIRGTRKP